MASKCITVICLFFFFVGKYTWAKFRKGVSLCWFTPVDLTSHCHLLQVCGMFHKLVLVPITPSACDLKDTGTYKKKLEYDVKGIFFLVTFQKVKLSYILDSLPVKHFNCFVCFNFDD